MLKENKKTIYIYIYILEDRCRPSGGPGVFVSLDEPESTASIAEATATQRIVWITNAESQLHALTDRIEHICETLMCAWKNEAERKEKMPEAAPNRYPSGISYGAAQGALDPWINQFHAEKP